MICETTDFAYPLLADIYYPIVETGAYGNLKKQWILDKTAACFFSTTGSKFKKDVGTEANINIDNGLLGRMKSNITVSSDGAMYSITTGPRMGQPTIFEVATLNPMVGPFGSVEYYKVILRRSENQATDL